MAEATGLTIVKRFTYRGDANEEWSNKYWLTGTPPPDPAGWDVLLDELVALEKACYTPQTSVVAAYGYDDNTPGAHSVWSWDADVSPPAVPGTLTAAQGINYAGDQAGMVEWQTDRKNSRGKWIYLRKYLHGGITHYTNPDEIAPETLAAYTAYAEALADGSGGLQGRQLRSQAQDESIINTYPSRWITTRTLKRRGKRP